MGVRSASLTFEAVVSAVLHALRTANFGAGSVNVDMPIAVDAVTLEEGCA